MDSELKKAINDNSDKPYIPSLHSVKKYSRLLNEELFKGKLSPINYIDIRRRQKKWAEYIVTKDGHTLLQITNRFHSKKHFIEVLAHELVHHWQYLNNEPLDHKDTFTCWKPKFKRKGLALELGY